MHVPQLSLLLYLCVRVWVSPLFSRLPPDGANTGDSVTHFKRDLLEYLGAYRQRALEEWMATIRQFDMSSAKFVPFDFIVSGLHCFRTSLCQDFIVLVTYNNNSLFK